MAEVTFPALLGDSQHRSEGTAWPRSGLVSTWTFGGPGGQR